MLWTKDDVQALTNRVLAFSKAEETVVTFTANEKGNVRFARNSVTTAGSASSASLVITATFGKKSGAVTTSEFDEPSLRRAVRSAENIAQLSPENPENMPAVAPQRYEAATAYSEDAANASAEWRADSVEPAISMAKRKEVIAAGFVETASAVQALGNSTGLFAFDRFTAADYNLTARYARCVRFWLGSNYV